MPRPLLPLAFLLLLSSTLLAGDPTDSLRDARELFSKGKYAEAAAKFAAAKGQASLTEKEVAAWAYCRVRMAADIVNKPTCDAASAAAAEKDVTEALQLAPNNTELQKVGQAVLVVARQRKAGPGGPPSNPREGGAASPVPADWEAVETASFTVRFKGTSRELAEKVGQTAEAKRKQTFERWSGPPGGAWGPKCEIVLHPSAECYAKMTGKPAAGTGHATVRLAEGKVTGRRIDLRADDDGLTANALPRELTHVVLADLFPFTPPPKWAEEGMAVLATSPEEIGRYTRTLVRCARGGELYTLAALLEMKDFPPAEKITGFYCGSVSLAGYLVKLKGEKQFTLFLCDCQRYGATQALKRQYDFESPKALQDAWLRAALEVARGQAP